MKHPERRRELLFLPLVGLELLLQLNGPMDCHTDYNAMIALINLDHEEDPSHYYSTNMKQEHDNVIKGDEKLCMEYKRAIEADWANKIMYNGR